MKLITLRGDDCKALTVELGADLRSAMQRMNQTGRTLLLVTEGERLAGVIADGDIRRYLVGGGNADEPVNAALNVAPTTFDHLTPLPEVRAFMMRRGFEYMPLTDGDHAVALCILDRAPQATELSAVIMAGGLGTRLAPLTDDCPKPLLPLGGKPILSHMLDHLKGQGVRRYVFSVSYLSHMIVDHYEDGSGWDCLIDYVHEPQRLGTGGPLSLVDPESISDPFLCINGDVLHDIDIGALRDTHTSNGWDATMVVREYTNSIPYGVVDTDGDGGFVEIREKPVQSIRINAGVYMLSKSSLPLIPTNTFYDLPRLFSDLRAQEMRCGTYLHHGRWIDIGTTPEYERANAILDDEADNR
jgi:dTDP-glucose pyrophosphorylase